MKIIIFDTETTGIPSPSLALTEQPYICQFGAVLIDCDMEARKLKKLQETDQLIRPAVLIPEECTAIHGITNEMVVDAPVISDFIDILVDLFHKADVAVAHNLSFDQAVIEYELQRLGRPKKFLPEQTFDTMNETKNLCKLPGRHGGYKSPTLNELHKFLFGEKFEGAHSALADVLATARCMKALLSRGIFRPKEPKSNQVSLF